MSGINLSEKTGKNVVVGIIDSGIDIHDQRLLSRCIGGGLVYEVNGYVEFISGEYEDTIGHGTAIANIILKKAPDVSFFIVKIFKNSLMCNSNLLSYSINKCLEFGCDIINISAGLMKSEPVLEETTKKAAAVSKVICSCANQADTIFYPSYYSWCYGVESGKCYKKYDYYFNKNGDIQFIARGDQQRLTWLSGLQVFLGGASFATAHISAIAALLLENDKNINKDNFEELLLAFSLQKQPEIVHLQNEQYISPYIISENEKHVIQDELMPNAVRNIKKAIIRGSTANFFTQIESLIPCEIVSTANDLCSETLQDYDSVIITETENIEEQLHFEQNELKRGKNVFYFTPNYIRESKRLELGLINHSYFVDEPRFQNDRIEQYKKKYPCIEYQTVRAPIAGYISPKNTIDSHAGFARFCHSLSKRGYKVVVFDTTSNSLLYGGQMHFCCNKAHEIETDYSHYVPSIRYLMQMADAAFDPDIILVYCAGALSEDIDTNTKMRFISVLVGVLIEGFIYHGKDGSEDISVIKSLTKSELIGIVSENSLRNSNAISDNKIVELLIEYFR